MSEEREPVVRRIRLGLVFATIALAVLIALALVVDRRSGWLHTLDQNVDAALNRYLRRNRGQLWFWKAVTAAGGPTVFRIAALIGAVILWWRRKRAAALFVVVAVGGTVVLSSAVKYLVGRHRPVLAHPVVGTLHSASFPSSHALASFVTLGALVVVIRPYVGRAVFAAVTAAAAVVAFLVGLSRMMLGFHFLTDIIGAWLLGGLWLAVVDALFAPHRRRVLPPLRQRLGSSG